MRPSCRRGLTESLVKFGNINLPDARAPTIVEHIHDDAVGFDGRHGARFV